MINQRNEVLTKQIWENKFDKLFGGSWNIHWAVSEKIYTLHLWEFSHTVEEEKLEKTETDERITREENYNYTKMKAKVRAAIFG